MQRYKIICSDEIMARINNIYKYKKKELNPDSILLGSVSPNGETVNYNIVDIALFVAGYIGDIEAGVQSIVEGEGISIDNADPKNPIISALGGDTPTLSEVLAEGNNAGDYHIYFTQEFPESFPLSPVLILNGNRLEYSYGNMLGSKGFDFRSINNGLIVNDSNANKGLVGSTYFGANYDDNTYVQKKYVTDNFLPLPTEGTSGQVLTTDGDGSYTWEDVGGGVSIHNDLTGIQGGSPNEYYHFNEIQHEKLLSLIYTNGTSTISVSPSSGERGVNATLTVNYSITSNDDVFGTATINQGIGDVTGDIDAGNQSKSGGNSTNNKSFTMSLSYTRNGEPETENKTTTYNTYIPQWAGWSAEEDFVNSYSSINSETNFQKYIQSSATINKVNSPTGEYIWFISNKNNATIKDTNDFVQTVGTWGDGTSEFYRKPLTLTLADGITTATVYLYRSRNVKTLSSFTYKIS